MKLKAWLDKNGISSYAFAESIGVIPTTVYRYIAEEKPQIPAPEPMIRIYLETARKVTPNDFYNLPKP